MKNYTLESVFVFGNEKLTVSKLASMYGVDAGILLMKINSGMSLHEALFVSTAKRERMITYKGETHSLTEWASILEIPYYCLRSRLNCLHWTVEKAFTTEYKRISHDK